MTIAVVITFHTKIQATDTMVNMEDQEDLEANPNVTMNLHKNTAQW